MRQTVASLSAPPRVLGALHSATGVLGGLGYAALIALVAERIDHRRGAVVNALAATGQRSMTCYLAQSPVWALTFTPFLLDLSGTLTAASTAVLAATVWLATVVLADRLNRAGRRGPFETLVRRVTYRAHRSASRQRPRVDLRQYFTGSSGELECSAVPPPGDCPDPDAYRGCLSMKPPRASARPVGCGAA